MGLALENPPEINAILPALYSFNGLIVMIHFTLFVFPLRDHPRTCKRTFEIVKHLLKAWDLSGFIFFIQKDRGRWLFLLNEYQEMAATVLDVVQFYILTLLNLWSSKVAKSGFLLPGAMEFCFGEQLKE